MIQWNADLYNQFGKERLQPSLDLVMRLPKRQYSRIIDIGCGSGMSTYALRGQFPDAKITGVDLSSTMLDKAKTLDLNATWIQRDCSLPLKDLGKFDLVFSNAFLQWLPDQASFLKQTKDLLSNGGIVAIQVPNWEAMPIKLCIDQVARTFEIFHNGVQKNCYNDSLNDYYDMLSEDYQNIEIWETQYVHRMDHYDQIIQFISSTGLPPYLEKLNEEDKQLFIQRLKALLPKCYPQQNDKKVLFKFQRILLIAQKEE